MSKRTYQAPAGATSITVNGKTYDVDGKGRLECSDDAAHADLLSHGYTYGDAVIIHSAADLAGMKSELEKHVGDLRAADAELTTRAAELDARETALTNLAAELDARAADLANRETALVLAQHAPPPPADTKPAKAKG